MSDFVSLGVAQNLLAVLNERGITTPTPIQAATLPDSLAGRDVLGRGRTGSGKTFAFLLPLVSRLAATRRRPASKRPRALILAPTRELVAQIEESLAPLEKATGLTSRTVFGGVKQGPQVTALARGVDIVIACPGRLLDLMGQNAVDLSAVEVAILDEADHMADMGFLPMVRRVLDAVPSTAQKMLFSATLDNGVDVLVKRYLHSPVVHEADGAASSVTTMDHHVLELANADKFGVLADLAAAPGKTILFTRTKHGAKKLAKMLVNRGIPTVDLHGNLAQNARTRNMDAFHSGRVETLVATDIAARGIHVDDVALVVHADPPTEHKAYLHRSGRTARAGKAGTVVTLVTPDQRHEVRGLMRAAKIHPTVSPADRGVLDELAPGERTFLSAEQAENIAYPNKEAAQPQPRAKVSSGRPSKGGQHSHADSQRRNGGAPRRAPRSGSADGGKPRAANTSGRRTEAVSTGGGSRLSAASFSASTGRRRGR